MLSQDKVTPLALVEAIESACLSKLQNVEHISNPAFRRIVDFSNATAFLHLLGDASQNQLPQNEQNALAILYAHDVAKENELPTFAIHFEDRNSGTQNEELALIQDHKTMQEQATQIADHFTQFLQQAHEKHQQKQSPPEETSQVTSETSEKKAVSTRESAEESATSTPRERPSRRSRSRNRDTSSSE